MLACPSLTMELLAVKSRVQLQGIASALREISPRVVLLLNPDLAHMRLWGEHLRACDELSDPLGLIVNHADVAAAGHIEHSYEIQSLVAGMHHSKKQVQLVAVHWHDLAPKKADLGGSLCLR